MGGLTLLGGGLASSIRLKISDTLAFPSIPRGSAVNGAAVRVDGGMVRHVVWPVHRCKRSAGILPAIENP